MSEPKEAFTPDWISPPGETIADLLDEKSWSQAELSARTGFTRKHISELVSGKAVLTPETALKLESVVGGSARFWLTREAQYQEALARRVADDALLQQADWLKELPWADMVRLGWVPKVSGKKAKVREALLFFSVASVDAWRVKYEKPLAAFRASTTVAKKLGATAAWLRQGEREAAQITCSAYTADGLKRALYALRGLTTETDPDVFVPRLVKACAAQGVSVVFVPAPSGCPASGAVRWIAKNKALMQMSLRYRTNDHLWFTIFHEAAHLLLHGKRLMFLEGIDGLDSDPEEEANKYAGDMLIPPVEARHLWNIAPSHEAVRSFAVSQGIAPGIVVGRMQKEGLIPWSHLNGLKISYQWG